MRSLKKDPKATNRQAGRAQGGKAGMSDAASEKLAKLSRQSGNANVKDQLSSVEGRRDDLLQFICERLKIVNEIQAVEIEVGGREREWFREVQKGEPGHFAPDGSRWHDTARLFMEAAHALCSGNLGRGVDLLEQAQEAERAAMESCPDQVVQKIMPAKRKLPEEPEAALDVASGAGCPTVARPMDLKYGEEVLAKIEDARETPAMKKTGPKTWWEELEEDEEEEADA